FQGRLASSCVTIAEVLQSAGYFTAMTGKWHVGQRNGSAPWQRGFQRSLNLVAGGVHFYNQTLRKNADAHLYLNGEPRSIDDRLFGTWYGPDLWTEWGLKFVDEAVQQQKPFFLYLSHCAPHFPLMAPESAIAKHRGKYQIGWDQLRIERYQRQIALRLIDPQWGLSEREESSPAWDSLSPELQQRFDHMMAIYAAMIETMDESVGELVAGLKERDVFDNTLVLFLSDNGGNAESGPLGRYEGEQPGGPASNVFLGQNWATLNNTPFRKWKRRVHEGGIATPLIAHWKEGIAAAASGTLVHQPAHVIDIMSTVVDVARASYPQEYQGHALEPMEGTSLTPTFTGGSVARLSPLFFNHDNHRAVRDGTWKLVALQDRPWELYDMSADRTELHDLAQEHPAIVAKMSTDYDEWSRRTRVVVDGELQPPPRESP
ncbi:MAG: sulfatase-like hydrolase/transferase, partial [Planctomycetota bacterium]|nr:sulfatase-like hydrolase/transferase [Planctomycetota bacterium]